MCSSETSRRLWLSELTCWKKKRHIKLLHIQLFPVAPVTGPPGRVSGHKDLCSLRPPAHRRGHRPKRFMLCAFFFRETCWKSFPANFDAAGQFFTDFRQHEMLSLPRFGHFRQGKWLLENRPRLGERSWTATALLSFSEFSIFKATATHETTPSLAYIPMGA